MADPFLGELKIVSFNFPPRGWAFCNGQLLFIAQNQALFSLLGTTYGGNGVTNFALPDLRGRTPLHPGSGINLGQIGGATTHSLTASEMGAHTHALAAVGAAAGTAFPSNAFLSQPSAGFGSIYTNAPASIASTSAAATTSAGGSQPHPNQQPFLGLNICIALQGVFPSRN